MGLGLTDIFKDETKKTTTKQSTKAQTPQDVKITSDLFKDKTNNVTKPTAGVSANVSSTQNKTIGSPFPTMNEPTINTGSVGGKDEMVEVGENKTSNLQNIDATKENVVQNKEPDRLGMSPAMVSTLSTMMNNANSDNIVNGMMSAATGNIVNNSSLDAMLNDTSMNGLNTSNGFENQFYQQYAK